MTAMAKLILLGTSTNIPDENHENTHMVLVGERRMVLIDSPGNPYSRLLKVGLDPDKLTDLVVTHFHPDHAGGVPLLLMAIGLSGRREGLNVYANRHCLERLKRTLEDYDWEKWHWFPVKFILLPDDEGHLFLDSDEFRLYSTPVKHFVPTVGLRIETMNRTLVYSGDTAPTLALDRLADGADILIHEAGGDSGGHSTAEQAGEAAKKSGAEELILIHYPVGEANTEILIHEAKKMFSGDVSLGVDFQEIDLD
jgi:ribonuclease Z